MKSQIWRLIITLTILALIACPVCNLTLWTLWPRPALPEARIAFKTLVCLAEQVADGQSPVLWATEAQPDGFAPDGFEIVPGLKANCPPSLTAVDRKF